LGQSMQGVPPAITEQRILPKERGTWYRSTEGWAGAKIIIEEEKAWYGRSKARSGGRKKTTERKARSWNGRSILRECGSGQREVCPSGRGISRKGEPP